MMNDAERLLVADLAAKLNFLAMNPEVRRRTRFRSIAALSKACGMSESWMKTAKSESRNTISIHTDVARKLGEVCGFDPNGPEWVSGSAEAFEKHYLAEAASPTHHAQPGASAPASAPITPDDREDAGGRHSVIFQNISNSNITVGLTPEELAFVREAVLAKTLLDAKTEQKLQTLSREVGETREVIESFFHRLDSGGDIAENWQQKLLHFAEDFRALRGALRALDPHDPDLRALRDQALLAADADDIERAKALLSRIDAERKASVANAEAELVNAAEVKAALGRVALLEFEYKRAAAHFRDASDMLPRKEAKKRREYREDEAGACVRQSDERGDNTALQKAIDLRRGLLQGMTRERMPLDWAAAQNNLGSVLGRLGKREGNRAWLQEAVAAYRSALEERTRGRVPLDWARTQTNLGSFLVMLGEQESGTARLEEAVAAYRSALEELPRERVPLDWARTQNNLGYALVMLAEQESGTARLEEAVAAYRSALEELPREGMALHWARTQNNLGHALAALGERESGTARLDEAVAVYRSALEERTRKRVPLDWAATQNNLGGALAALGERESGTARLKEAVAAYRGALEESTRQRVPLDWATTQNNLGYALAALGGRESGTAWLEEAVAAYRSALEERTRDRVPLDRATTQDNLGVALATLGERESGTPSATDWLHPTIPEQCRRAWQPQELS